MERTKEMQAVLDAFTQKIFGRKQSDCHSDCVTCGKTINPQTDFKDALSLKEWDISHMCQECQNSVFRGVKDE